MCVCLLVLEVGHEVLSSFQIHNKPKSLSHFIQMLESNLRSDCVKDIGTLKGCIFCNSREAQYRDYLRHIFHHRHSFNWSSHKSASYLCILISGTSKKSKWNLKAYWEASGVTCLNSTSLVHIALEGMVFLALPIAKNAVFCNIHTPGD